MKMTNPICTAVVLIKLQFGQWILEVTADGYKFYNPMTGDNGTEWFYSLIMGSFGQPLIKAENSFALEAPANLRYVDQNGNPVDLTEKIAGVVCLEGPRSSLSKAQLQGNPVILNDDGSLSIAGETWWIVTLFQKDKNRIFGYDAFCSRERPEQVQVIELAELLPLLTEERIVPELVMRQVKQVWMNHCLRDRLTMLLDEIAPAS